MEYAFFEDKIVPVEEAKISIKTNSFHYGTCVFEGIRGLLERRRRTALYPLCKGALPANDK
jgi:branched-subunit amino acid aminotransferase/4-amino-4-deoxychorismate lyase